MSYKEVLNRIKKAKDNNSKNLDLSWLDLEEIPKEVFELTNLTRLDLFDNQIVEIPSEIAKLKNLTELILYYNQIVKLPSELGELTSLKELYLGNNQLSSLPMEIKKLKNLRDFNSNSFLKNEAFLKGNKFNIPNEVYKKTPIEQIEYILKN